MSGPRAVLAWTSIVGCSHQTGEQRQALVSENVMGKELKIEKILPSGSMFFSCHFWIVTFHLTFHMEMMTQSAGLRNDCTKHSFPFKWAVATDQTLCKRPLQNHLTTTLAQEVAIILIFKPRLGVLMGWAWTSYPSV